MRIVYDVSDMQVLQVAPAPEGFESAFVCEVPEPLVTEYLRALETLKNTMGALERAIG